MNLQNNRFPCTSHKVRRTVTLMYTMNCSCGNRCPVATQEGKMGVAAARDARIGNKLR